MWNRITHVDLQDCMGKGEEANGGRKDKEKPTGF